MTACDRCGKQNQPHYRFCLGCGKEISSGKASGERKAQAGAENGDSGAAAAPAERPRAQESQPKPPPAKEPASPRRPMASDSEVAPRSRSARICAVCGEPVPIEFAFCGQCGARLEAGGKSRISGSVSVAQPMPQPQASPRGRLILVRADGSEGGAHPLVEGENMIGRGAGQLFDADGFLSPKHAELVLNAAGLVVRDTASLNGVFLKLSEEEQIGDRTIFRIGQELLRFDEILAPEPLEDGTEVLGSPNPGYWGRLALVVGPDQDGSAFPLFGDSIILGRERGDILFPEDGYVSGTHARISMREGRFYLADLNSSNGTFVRIRNERTIRSGSYLLLGQQLFRVVFH